MSPRKSFEEIAKSNVANLVDYAVGNLGLDEADVVYVTNILLDMLKLTEPAPAPSEDYDFYTTLGALSEYAVKKNICEEADRLLLKPNLWAYSLLRPPKS